MVNFPLEELDDYTFEQVAVALARCVMGPGVTVFGDGPDGGREATFEGPVDWAATVGAKDGEPLGNGRWDGYVVIQSKHHRTSDLNPGRNLRWLQRELDGEIDRWIKNRRARFPKYLLIVSNAKLSAVDGSGGIDQLSTHLRERADKEMRRYGFRDWTVWHRDQVVSLLLTYAQVRQGFSALLTKGDLLERLKAIGVATGPDDLKALLVGQAASALRHERATNFNEAGSEAQFALDQIVVDLPVRNGGQKGLLALPEIVTHGDRVLRKSLLPDGSPRHILLTGAPGNGKSTLSRFITQAYRATFLGPDAPTEQVGRIVTATNTALRRLKVAAPHNQRWPVRIDLATMASENPFGTTAFMNWLAQQLSKRTDIPMRAADLRTWMRMWPWVVIFDGLDEVTAPSTRRAVLDTISGFIDDVDSMDADAMVVVTTRPTGYTDELPLEHFVKYELDYLSLEQARTYGKHVIAARLATNRDRMDTVTRRFLHEAEDKTTQRLLKTPLQVLIITVILERLGALPPDRYSLFSRYYDTIYDRETGKPNDLAAFLATHKPEITYIHEMVGLLLQHRSEIAEDSQALLGVDALRKVAQDRLVRIGHEPGYELDKITDRILDAVRERLVLLVPGGDDTVMFEVRSLQELMAARALSTGLETDIESRLAALAPSPHWRNTWLFIAGRLFADPEERKWSLVTDLLDDFARRSPWPEWLMPVVPGLAAELLDDGLAEQKPKWLRELAQLALRALSVPIPTELPSIARGLASVANEKPEYRSMVWEALRHAVPDGDSTKTRLDDSAQKAAAGTLWRTGGFTFAKPAGVAEQQTLLDVRAGRVRGTNRLSVKAFLEPQLAEIVGSPDGVLAAALTELGALKTSVAPNGNRIMCFAPPHRPAWTATMAALDDPDASAALQLAFTNATNQQWRISALMAHELFGAMSRRPVDVEELRLPDDARKALTEYS